MSVPNSNAIPRNQQKEQEAQEELRAGLSRNVRATESERWMAFIRELDRGEWTDVS